MALAAAIRRIAGRVAPAFTRVRRARPLTGFRLWRAGRRVARTERAAFGLLRELKQTGRIRSPWGLSALKRIQRSRRRLGRPLLPVSKRGRLPIYSLDIARGRTARARGSRRSSRLWRIVTPSRLLVGTGALAGAGGLYYATRRPQEGGYY
jgi:hypothetical protein